MMTHVQFVLLVTLLYIVPNGLTIRCYSCRSDIDPNCADPFDPNSVPISYCNYASGLPTIFFPRTFESSYCMKSREKVNGSWVYIRDCVRPSRSAAARLMFYCTSTTGPGNNYTEHCTCDSKDGCNSSTMFTPVPILLVTLVAFYKVFV